MAPAGAAERPLKTICFLFDPKVGGPHVCARAICERLIARGHEARIAIPAGAGGAGDFFAGRVPLDRLAIARPAPPRRFGAFLRYLFGLPRAVLRTRAYLVRQKPDVIRVNGALDLVPVIAGRLAGVPVVLYLNDTVFPPWLSRLLVRIGRWLGARPVAAAHRVAAHHGLAGAEVIFEPVDTDRFPARPPDGFPGTPPVLGLIANWNPVKRQDRFLDVVERLRAGGLDLRGRVLGGFPPAQRGWWRPILARLASGPLAGAVEAPGFVGDMPAALAGLDLVLLTSTSEACPVSVLEAMATGVPVVAFDVGGVAELLGTDGTDGGDPAGVVVAEGDIRAMADAVRALLADPARYRAMARSGPARAGTRFSLGACVARHEALAAALAGARAGRGAAHG